MIDTQVSLTLGGNLAPNAPCPRSRDLCDRRMCVPQICWTAVGETPTRWQDESL